ncbi:MAG: molybdopterin synthase sulfur carrier subunit [Zetaproteobacteria bacterium]|nr:molybdopterin synthase sulfur carrier subunit [Pseudobdellovibrionaceae bacterium]
METREVRVKYFAVLKEIVGKDEDAVLLHEGETGAALYLRLAEKYHFPLKLAEIRVAINDDFASMDRELLPTDEVVFIPPVAGG